VRIEMIGGFVDREHIRLEPQSRGELRAFAFAM
jgi:hypothetical protein